MRPLRGQSWDRVLWVLSDFCRYAGKRSLTLQNQGRQAISVELLFTSKLSIMIPRTGRLGRVSRVLLAWALTLPALGVLIALYWLAWPVLQTCENSRLRDIDAPGGGWRLVVYEQRCTGTVEWTTHVSVVRAYGMLPRKDGNVLVSFGRHGSLVGKTVQEPEVEAQWQGPEVIELARL